MDKLIDRFLAWPLPDSVCPDACTINKRAHGAPIPTGTNLLSAIEARQMLEHVLADTIQIPPAEYEKLKADAERLDWLDSLNAKLNAHYGTTYQWRLVLSPNVVRLMAGEGSSGHVAAIDLHDSAPNGVKSCRAAIDAAIKQEGGV